jgi:hypothetical protein
MKFNEVENYNYIEETSALFQTLALYHIMLQEGRLDEAGIWDAVKGTVGGVMRGIKSANDAVDKLGQLAQNTKPVQAFDARVDEILSNIKQKLEQKAPKVVVAAEKYAAWAKKNPIKQGLIIGALTAVAALASGPGAAAAAGFILRAANEYMKGEQASTAIGKGMKSAALGYGAGVVAQELVKPLANMLSGLVIKQIPFSLDGVSRFNLGQGYTMRSGGLGREMTTTISGRFDVPTKDAGYIQDLIQRLKTGDVGAFKSLEAYTSGTAGRGFEARQLVKDAFAAASQKYDAAVSNNGLLKLISAVKSSIPALAQGAVTADDRSSKEYNQISQQLTKLDPADKQKLIAYLKQELGTV